MAELSHNPRAVELSETPKKPEQRTGGAEELSTKQELELPSFEALRGALEQQVDTLQRQFKVKHRNLLRWAEKQGYQLAFLAPVAGRAMMAGGLMLSLLTSAPQTMAGLPHTSEAQIQQQLMEARAKSDQVRAQKLLTVQMNAQQQQARQQQMMDQLHQLVTHPTIMHDDAVAQQVTETIHELTGLPLATTLEGYALNTNIGRIGAEQHLKRYPGDSLSGHALTGSGMAPGLGAYGYFAQSASALTPQAIEREKYYVALQTFKSPNWAGNVSSTYNWFKYRKMLVYHPVTGKAVVAVVGDAGPGLSTGKAYGGSPEVMAALNAHDGRGTPPVVMLFVNDPTDSIPLGPVEIHSLHLENIR